NGDNNIPDKQLNINANNGVVTLTGTVSSDAARNAAANDAAQVEGVKTVVNNLQVAPTTADQMGSEDQAPPPPMREEPRPSPRTRPSSSRSNSGNNGLRTTVPSSRSSGYDSAQSSAPYTPAPAQPQKISVPAGTQLSIRLNDEVDSEKAQVGDVFHG